MQSQQCTPKHVPASFFVLHALFVLDLQIELLETGSGQEIRKAGGPEAQRAGGPKGQKAGGPEGLGVRGARGMEGRRSA